MFDRIILNLRSQVLLENVFLKEGSTAFFFLILLYRRFLWHCYLKFFLCLPSKLFQVGRQAWHSFAKWKKGGQHDTSDPGTILEKRTCGNWVSGNGHSQMHLCPSPLKFLCVKGVSTPQEEHWISRNYK